MSIADRITSITQHTREAYNGLSKLGADLTGVNKNLDNIANVLDDVYAGYPKVTGSGTELSLSNCKKAGMEIEYKGNTSQESTTGKNLFNGPDTTNNNGVTFTKNADGSYNISGTPTAEANAYNYVPIADTRLEDGQTYTISINQNKPSNLYILAEVFNGNSWLRHIAFIVTETQSKTNTIDLTNATQIRFGIRATGTSAINITNLQIQLEKASSATEWEKFTNGASPNPDYPEDIHTVTGNNTIRVSGKNLFDVDSFNKIDKTYISGGITSIISNGKISCNGTATSTSFGIGSSDYTFSLKLKSNTNYVFSRTNAISERLYIRLYNADKSQYQDVQIVANSTSTSFTTNFEVSSCYLFMAGHSNGDNISINSFGVMVEQGSTATTYEPYQAPGNYPVNLRGKNLFDKNNVNIEQGGWISAVGVKGNGDNNKLFKLPIKPSTTYTIQKIAGNRFRAGTYQNGNIANGTSFNVFQQNDSGTSITITSTATDTYLYVQYLAGDTNEQQLLDSIQIEERFYSYYLSVILEL